MNSRRPAASRWIEASVADVAADLLLPPEDAPPVAAIVWLPDYDGRSIRQFPAGAAALEQVGLPVLSLRTAHCWWTPQPDSARLPAAPLDFVRETLCEFIAREWGIQPPRIGLAGIGTGGQGALQVAYRHARSFPTVAAIAPAIDFHIWHGRGLDLDRLYDSQEAARQQTVTLHLHPLNWPRHQLLLCDPADPFWFEGCERLASKLTSSGIPFTCDFETTAGGHRDRYIDLVAEPFTQFLAKRLGQA